MNSWIDCDVRYANHRERVARIERAGWLWGRPTADAGGPTSPATAARVRHLRDALGVERLVGAAFGRLAAFAHDGRDGLRSKEQDLAAHGVRWGKGYE